MKAEDLFLVFVKHYNNEVDGTFSYELFFSKTPEIVWGVDWDVIGPNTNNDMTPDKTTYEKICIINTPFPLKTIQDITCYSMEYAINRIIALSWIDIENMDEYPENGRMVFHFGDTFDEIKELLEKYNINLTL